MIAGITTTLPVDPDQAETLIRAALTEQGFGVLTEIDVAATLKAKLGVDRPHLKILGACNPGFANRALDVDPTASLLLPCNVVIEAVDGGSRVTAADPRELMTDPRLADLVTDVSAKLEAAVRSLDPA